MTRRDPVEVWPPAAYIEDELEERGWCLDDLLAKASPDDVAVAAVMEGQRMTRRAARALADVFQTSVELWLRLDAVWWEWLALRVRKTKA
jgi:plasmid maintenance system antidote protein VapI